jgi:DivIVA domain-containing protein
MRPVAQTFTRSPWYGRGYAPDQVDAFLERARSALQRPGQYGGVSARQVRTVGFDLVRGGYVVDEVDAALDRLEDELAQRERDAGVQRLGRQAWLAEATSGAQALRNRLARPDGERFPRGQGLELGYSRADVDALCHQLAAYFAAGEAVPAEEVRAAVFRSALGSRGYREGPVDVFLDRVVEVLIAAQ